MKPIVIATAVAVLLAPGAAPAAGKPPLPRKVGACVLTTVRSVGQRLEDGATHQPIANSGSSVVLANGIVGVFYDQVPAVNTSRPGDRVRACLAGIPRGCPPGDTRGRTYTATNLRTRQSWTLPDAEHMCGGA